MLDTYVLDDNAIAEDFLEKRHLCYLEETGNFNQDTCVLFDFSHVSLHPSETLISV